VEDEGKTTMKFFAKLSFVTAAAVAGFLTIQATPALAAAAVHTPAVQSAAPSQVAETAYYYSHGRRYAYRYHGMYFNHRYYRGNVYHYY
jgi:hypothetical protein